MAAAPNRGRGILGIERQIRDQEISVDRNISEAFHDLKQLMQKAKEMSATAKSIAQKVKDRSNKDISDDETIVFKSHLLALGVGTEMDDPVTRKQSANESAYFVELGKQIAALIKPVLDNSTGQMPLTDLYCTVNRARGLELISTEDLLNACYTLEKQRSGLRLVQFDSGLLVVQSDQYNSEKVSREISDMVQQAYDSMQCGLSAQSLAVAAGISSALAKQRLLAAELRGFICRDESLQGMQFWPNRFLCEQT
jgi:ESCRT-II complex subunit VPS36